ncbi:MAG: glycosyltransferase family 4 protein [Clostridia bacterium]|nr:glycosyltransferase family 4 protein [Clostridia bacterium]
MRIMMLTWEYPPRIVGGIARVVHDLSHVFANQGHEVHVITYKEGNTKEFEKDGEVFVHRIETYPINANNLVDWVMQFNFCVIEKAADVIKEFGKFDVVHAHDWLVAYSARTIKNSYKIPLVATIHATESGRNKGIHDKNQGYVNDVEWLLTYEASDVICNSLYMKNEISHLFGKPWENIHVVPNGINVNKFDGKVRDWDFRRNYASDNEKIIFFAGRIVYEKGIQILLDAAPKILQNYNDVKFIIAGRGPCLDELKSQAERLGISNRVYFTGYLNDVQITKMYKAADVAVFPSLYEPFGIVALEGMLSGAATVVSDTGGLNEIVSHGIDGMKSYSGNANSLADSILEVLFNHDLCKQIAKNAYQKVTKEYNWEIIAKKTMDVYKQTIKTAKANQVKVKFEEKAGIKEKLPSFAPLSAQEDNTITTSSTDSEIRGILPNPLRKFKKATD